MTQRFFSIALWLAALALFLSAIFEHQPLGDSGVDLAQLFICVICIFSARAFWLSSPGGDKEWLITLIRSHSFKTAYKLFFMIGCLFLFLYYEGNGFPFNNPFSKSSEWEDCYKSQRANPYMMTKVDPRYWDEYAERYCNSLYGG
jgi:hypothetical protein